MINQVVSLFRRALRKRGWAIVRIQDRNLKASEERQGFFQLLHSMKFRPRHILDVGANRGNWTRDALHFFPECQFTLLEPNRELEPYLADLVARSNVEWLPKGAARESGKLLFTVAERDDSSSFAITEQLAASRNLKQLEVDVTCINDLVEKDGYAVPDLVKIDAEGLDIEVLEGATHLFGMTEFFCVEAGFSVAGSTSKLKDVLNLMDANGYLPFDFVDLNRSPRSKILWLCEICFVRSNSPLLEGVTY